MEYGKTRLIRMLRNVPKEGWTFDKIKDLVDSLWRDRPRYLLAKIDFANTATPTVADYQANYAAVFGEYPTVRLFTEDGPGKEWERQEKPVYNRTAGLLISVVYDLSSNETGYIIISR